jgi:hypothetical protein
MSKKLEFQKAEISFTKGGKNYSFMIYHNLPGGFRGPSIQDALKLWLLKAKNLKAKTFCNFINHSYTNALAVPSEMFERAKEKSIEIINKKLRTGKI